MKAPKENGFFLLHVASSSCVCRIAITHSSSLALTSTARNCGACGEWRTIDIAFPYKGIHCQNCTNPAVEHNSKRAWQ